MRASAHLPVAASGRRARRGPAAHLVCMRTSARGCRTMAGRGDGGLQPPQNSTRRRKAMHTHVVAMVQPGLAAPDTSPHGITGMTSHACAPTPATLQRLGHQQKGLGHQTWGHHDNVRASRQKTGNHRVRRPLIVPPSARPVSAVASSMCHGGHDTIGEPILL